MKRAIESVAGMNVCVGVNTKVIAALTMENNTTRKVDRQATFASLVIITG
jgi:hypothetical protein